MMSREQVVTFLKDILNYEMIQSDFENWTSNYDSEYGINRIADKWMFDQQEIIQQYDPMATSAQPFEV